MIELKNIVKKYGKDVTALKGIDMSVKKGEFVSVIGKSGSGKSTLFRTLAGLEYFRVSGYSHRRRLLLLWGECLQAQGKQN